MPSGKRSKEQRRTQVKTPPRVQAKGSTRSRQASPRVLLAVGGAIVLIAIAVVLAIVLTGGSSSSSTKDLPKVGSIATGLPGSADVEATFKGIPQTGEVLGWASAPVTMKVYIDLQCPICQQFETTVLPGVLKDYVRTKKVKIEVRTWAFIGSDSFRGQRAAFAAAAQNKLYNFNEILYVNQGTENTGWLTDRMVGLAAASIPGLDVTRLVADASSASVKAAATNVDAQAATDKVTGTPSVYVGKSGGKLTYVPLQNGTDSATLTAALNTALAGS